MKVLLIEDDYLFAQEVREDIRRELQDIDVDVIGNESSFLEHFPEIQSTPPDAIILDLMLPFSRHQPHLSSNEPESHVSGGMRCLKRLLEGSRTKSIPVIVHSAGGMLPGDFPGNVLWVPKSGDARPLLSAIRSALFLGWTESEQRVFVVHGHDEHAKEVVARLLERLGLRPVILQEQPNGGAAILDKLEAHSRAAFAIVLLTPDDVGAQKDHSASPLPRARQNVILELGFFLGRLGKARVCTLLKETVEIPSDYHGILYVKMDHEGAWRTRLASEMVAAGLRIDTTKLLA